MTPFRRRFRKTIYYITRAVGTYLPEPFFRNLRARHIAYLDPRDPRIKERVNYYNKLARPFRLGADAATINELRKAKKNTYFFDLYEFARYFGPDRRFRYQFGDVREIPPQPTLLKARPIEGDNANSVLFNLNKIRHFYFVRDPFPLDQKDDILVWRGEAYRTHRKEFLRKFAGRAGFDVGQVNRDADEALWRPYLSIRDQLKHKFIFSIEGNDVATNTKWIMASNSVCVMRKPCFETWFMEGKLIPGTHYIQVRDDFSDLEEKLEYYSSHPGEVKEIVQNANRYVSQFSDPALERQISLLVLQKYFDLASG